MLQDSSDPLGTDSPCAASDSLVFVNSSSLSTRNLASSQGTRCCKQTLSMLPFRKEGSRSQSLHSVDFQSQSCLLGTQLGMSCQMGNRYHFGI